MEGGYERHYMKISFNDNQDYGLALVNIEQNTIG